MRNLRDLFCGFGLGVGVVVGLCLMMGVITYETDNVDPLLGGGQMPLSLAVSDQGNFVYVADANSVYLSENFGQDWRIVLTRGQMIDPNEE
jgi:DNA-binding beta-propeller fold protein YncE